MSRRLRVPLMAALGVSLVSGAVAAYAGGGTSAQVIATAKAQVKAHTANPTIGITAKLSKKPAKGKTFEFLQCNYPVCAQIGDGMKAATKALGWKFVRKTFDLTKPESLVSAVNAAAASPPSYLALTTFPPSVWADGLAKLKAKKVPVIIGSVSGNYVKGASNGIYGNIASDPSEGNAGTQKAYYAIADSGGKAKVVHFAATDIATTGAETNSLKAGIAKCGGCSLSVVKVSSAALGAGKVPSMTVAYLQAHPDTQYISYSFGDMTAGVDTALKAAGLDKKIKYLGVTPTLQNLQALKSGAEQGAWLGWPATLQGWQFVDVAARLSVGDPVGKAASPLLPVRWLTKSTAPTTLYEPSGYEQAYESLWRLK